MTKKAPRQKRFAGETLPVAVEAPVDRRIEFPLDADDRTITDWMELHGETARARWRLAHWLRQAHADPEIKASASVSYLLIIIEDALAAVGEGGSIVDLARPIRAAVARIGNPGPEANDAKTVHLMARVAEARTKRTISTMEEAREEVAAEFNRTNPKAKRMTRKRPGDR